MIIVELFVKNNHQIFPIVKLSGVITIDLNARFQKKQIFKSFKTILEILPMNRSTQKFKNAKTFIRKAENPMDVLLGYMVFTNGAELKMAATEKFEVEGIYIPIK